MAVEGGLIGYWPFCEDVRDHSTCGLEVQNLGVRIAQAAPGGPYRTAAHFDGRGSQLVVAEHPALCLGTDAFSLAAWVYTADRGGDVAGDIVSRFDPQERRGFALSVVTNGGVTSTTQGNYRNLHFGIDCGQLDGRWMDHGRPGRAVKITALHVSDNKLYAGTFELGAEEQGHLWLYDGGNRWLDLGASPDGSNAVHSISRWEGRLYCATGRYNPMGSALGALQNPRPGGRIYWVEEDGNWIECGHPGAEDATPEEVPTEGYETGKADDAIALTVFEGRLHVTSNHRRGAFVYEGEKHWTYIGPHKRILSFTIYQGALYALINGGDVLRYVGGTEWEDCGRPAGSTQTYSAALYRGQLYVGTWPEGEVFRYDGGQSWTLVSRVGYEREIMAMAVYNSKLYVGALPMANVYRMDGNRFSLVGNLDSTLAYLRRVWSMAVYRGRLYAGTLPSGHIHSLQAGAMVTWDRTWPRGWHHVVGVRGEERLHLYVDGERVASSAYLRGMDYDLTHNISLEIGSGVHSPFQGAMNEVRLYNRALTAEEVRMLFQI